MKIIQLLTILLAAVHLHSCQNQVPAADAYGNFEATEVTVAAQVHGPLLELNLNEGDVIKSGTPVGFIDSVPLLLRRDQLEAQRQAMASRHSGVTSRVDVLQQQKKNAVIEQGRIQRLLKENAATQKQLDEVNGEIDVITKQMESVYTENSTIGAELKSVDAQIAQINDQIARSVIVNPVTGTVLTKFAEASELTSPGQFLYKIADLDTLQLRVFIGGDQLAAVTIGQRVKVRYDTGRKTYGETSGTVSWISPQAEFTPKIVQTKNQRTNLVYAVKIAVPNQEGKMKIGMPGEMLISK
jgi:HlyD family secretion protein